MPTIVVKPQAGRNQLLLFLGRESIPFLSLIAPSHFQDGPNQPLGDHVPSSPRRGKEKQRFLNVRCQGEQIHDLRQPGLRNTPKTGEFCLIGHDAIANQLIEADGQGPLAAPRGARGRARASRDASAAGFSRIAPFSRP